jgi:hypothetical protein
MVAPSFSRLSRIARSHTSAQAHKAGQWPSKGPVYPFPQPKCVVEVNESFGRIYLSVLLVVRAAGGHVDSRNRVRSLSVHLDESWGNLHTRRHRLIPLSKVVDLTPHFWLKTGKKMRSGSSPRRGWSWAGWAGHRAAAGRSTGRPEWAAVRPRDTDQATGPFVIGCWTAASKVKHGPLHR